MSPTNPARGAGRPAAGPAAEQAGPAAEQMGPAAEQMGPAAEQAGPAAEQMGSAAEQMGPAGRPRRVLVTGATGYLGSRLAAALVGMGAEVHVLARPTSSLERVPSGVAAVHRVDGSHSTMGAAVAAADPEVCFHLAGLVAGRHAKVDAADLVSANVVFGTRLAEALAATGRLPLLVNAGTYWQHAGGRRFHPVNLYAATKQAFEDILRSYAIDKQVRVVTLALPDTYGPGDPRRKILNLLFDAARNGIPLETTSGRQLLDLVHVDDVVAAFLLANTTFAAAPAPLFRAFSVSSGTPISLRHLVGELAAVTGIAVPVRWGTRAYPPREMFHPWRYGAPLPGWAPDVALPDGLLALWQATA